MPRTEDDLKKFASATLQDEILVLRSIEDFKQL